MKTTLLVPVLNEIEGMRVIMPRVKKEWVDEILVIDGGSTDGSFEFAQKSGYVTLRQQSKGLTRAEWEGAQAASGDVIINFSPDGNSVPERIPELVRKMREGYDMVIASRYARGANNEDDTLVTALGNRMFTKMINLFFGGNYSDTLVIFRAWKKEILKNLSFRESALEPQLCIECARRKLKVAEIPGDEPKRIGGKAKMHPLLNGLWISKMLVAEFFSPPLLNPPSETEPVKMTHVL